MVACVHINNSNNYSIIWSMNNSPATLAVNERRDGGQPGGFCAVCGAFGTGLCCSQLLQK